MERPREIVTRTERISVVDGVIRCVVLPTTTHTFEDAQENTRAVTTVTGGERLPMLLDTRVARGLERDARMYYVRPEAAGQITALAMLIDSYVSRVLGNFFTTVNRPPFPVRLFTDEADALAWLKGQVG